MYTYSCTAVLNLVRHLNLVDLNLVFEVLNFVAAARRRGRGDDHGRSAGVSVVQLSFGLHRNFLMFRI
jgi:hypothetical protein